jgi:hypothetical protein
LLHFLASTLGLLRTASPNLHSPDGGLGPESRCPDFQSVVPLTPPHPAQFHQSAKTGQCLVLTWKECWQGGGPVYFAGRRWVVRTGRVLEPPHSLAEQARKRAEAGDRPSAWQGLDRQSITLEGMNSLAPNEDYGLAGPCPCALRIALPSSDELRQYFPRWLLKHNPLCQDSLGRERLSHTWPSSCPEGTATHTHVPSHHLSETLARGSVYTSVG